MDYLFELIHSLSPGERRFFRSTATTFQNRSESLELFDYMLQQESWSDDLLVKFKDGISGNEMAQKKRYLKELVLKSLRTIKKDQDPYLTIMAHIHDARTLHRKNLISQAMKSLAKGKKIAMKHEHFGLHLEILQWELKLTQTNDDNTQLRQELKAEQATTETLAQRLLEVQNTLANLFDTKKKRGVLPWRKPEFLDQDLPEGFWSSDYPMGSQKIQFYWYWARSLYFFLREDIAEALEEIEHVSLRDNNFIPPDEVVNALLHRAACCIHTCQFEEGKRTMQMLEEHSQNEELSSIAPVREQIFYYTRSYGLTCALYQQDEEAMQALIDETEAYLESGETVPSIIYQVLRGNVATCQFYLGHTGRSKRSYSQILGLGKAALRSDVSHHTLFILPLVLMVHGDYDLLDAQLRSSIRYFKNDDSHDRSKLESLQLIAKWKNFEAPESRLELCSQLSNLAGFDVPGCETLLPPARIAARVEEINTGKNSSDLDLSRVDFVHVTAVSILCKHWIGE